MAGVKLCLGQRDVEPVAVDLPYVPVAFGRDLLGSSSLNVRWERLAASRFCNYLKDCD